MRLVALYFLGALAVALQDDREAPTGQVADVHAEWRGTLTRDGREVRLEHEELHECEACHLTVAEEWRHSRHATAWQDEHYRKELRKVKKKDRCTGCHAPEPLAAANYPMVPATREHDPHFGVDCKTCHLAADGKTILGPYGVMTDAHKSEKSAKFDGFNNELCISCHSTTIGPVIGLAEDFIKSRQEDLGLSCVGCHMTGLRGAIANDDEGTEYEIRHRRSHRLNTPRDPGFLASAFGTRAELHDGQVVVVIENMAGHRIPGTTRRDTIFKLELIDRHGDVIEEHEHQIDHRSFLPVDERVEVEFELRGAKVQLTGLHKTDGMRKPLRFLEKELTPE